MLTVPWNRGTECTEGGGGRSHSSLFGRNRKNVTQMPVPVPQSHPAVLLPARQSRRLLPWRRVSSTRRASQLTEAEDAVTDSQSLSVE